MAMQSMPSKPMRGADWDGWGDTIDTNMRSIASDLPAVQSSVAALTQRVTTAENAISGKATLSGLASVATSGNYADLIGTPAGSVMSTTSMSVRPTARTDIRVHWHTPEPPTAVMVTGDTWIPS